VRGDPSYLSEPMPTDKAPRTVPELIVAALQGDQDDEQAWEAVHRLRARADQETWDAAVALIRSSRTRERGRGVDILAQFGASTSTPRSPELRARCADQLLECLRTEQDAAVLNAIGVGLGHLDDPRAVQALLPLRNHPDEGVRFGVVFGLGGHETPEAIDALIQLSADPDDDVRDWATFELGTISELDTRPLREALVARLGDENAEIRGEALAGLACRKDPRVVEPLRRELAGGDVGVLALEAAQKLGDVSLFPLLEKLRPSGDSFFDHVLEDVVRQLRGER